MSDHRSYLARGVLGGGLVVYGDREGTRKSVVSVVQKEVEMSEQQRVVELGLMSFENLAEARRDWIQQVLRPWCQAASLKELRKAEQEWLDIAGRVDAKATLWTWAWERFPEIVHAEMPGVHETWEVNVLLKDGRERRGYPDNRQSLRGMLVLITRSAESGLGQTPTMSIDEIQTIHRIRC